MLTFDGLLEKKSEKNVPRITQNRSKENFWEVPPTRRQKGYEQKCRENNHRKSEIQDHRCISRDQRTPNIQHFMPSNMANKSTRKR